MSSLTSLNFIFGYLVMIGSTIMFASPRTKLASVSGVAVLAVGLLFYSSTARADERLFAKDNSEVLCSLSRSGLTRISLDNDKFAAISKLETGNPSDEFTIVNEPTRGDLYVSVSSSFNKKSISFFGTSQKGYVYKFSCRLVDYEAQQVFVVNEDLALKSAPVASESRQEHVVSLVEAMSTLKPLPGYSIRQDDFKAVQVGQLNVQLIATYEGELRGQKLRIKNTSNGPITVDQNSFQVSNGLAFGVENPDLAKGEETVAFVVSPGGE
jgi:conjugal transfer pilus assembly protein TraK